MDTNMKDEWAEGTPLEAVTDSTSAEQQKTALASHGPVISLIRGVDAAAEIPIVATEHQGDFESMAISRVPTEEVSAQISSIAQATMETNVVENAPNRTATRAENNTRVSPPAISESTQNDGIQLEKTELPTQDDMPMDTSTNSQAQELEDRNGEAEFETDSSPYTSSSSESDSSDDESDDEFASLDPAEQARRLMEDDVGSDGEGGNKASSNRQPRTLHEQADEVVEVPNVTITPEMKIEELGNVQSVVDNLILVKAKTSGEYQVLEYGSVLCLENKTVIGIVAETLGRVQEPLYCVRFTNAAKISDLCISKGSTIYYLPSHSTFVFTKALQGIKGSDASNIHDEEAGADEIEFSDDEAEAEYKKNLKQKKQAKRAERGGPGGGFSQGRQRDLYRHQGHQAISDSPALSYDDKGNNGELYTPLSRPADLSDMLGAGPVSTEFPQEGYSRASHRGHSRGGRGRGRGDWRGRGDRRGGFHERPTNSVRQYPSLPPTPTFPTPIAPQVSNLGNSWTSQQSFLPNAQGTSPSQYSPHLQYQNSFPQSPSYGQQQASFNTPSNQAPLPGLGMPYHPQQYQPQITPSFAQLSQSSTIPPLPAGAYVNPAFFANQQQALSQAAYSPQSPQEQAQTHQNLKRQN